MIHMILYIHCGNIKLYKENQPHTNYYYSKFIKNKGLYQVHKS